MNKEEQVLELNRTTEEKVKLDPKALDTGQEQRLKSNQKYKTVFNCSYSEVQE